VTRHFFTDPFNRQPLTINMVEPDVELRNKCDLFNYFCLVILDNIFSFYRIKDWLDAKIAAQQSGQQS
jgi:hypothetical protein